MVSAANEASRGHTARNSAGASRSAQLQPDWQQDVCIWWVVRTSLAATMRARRDHARAPSPHTGTSAQPHTRFLRPRGCQRCMSLPCRTGKCGLNDVHVLNVDTLEWSTVSTYSGTAPSTRNNHATFVYGTKLFIHGGHDGMHWLDDMHVLETAELGASSSSAAALSGTGSPAAGGGMELRWTQPVVAGTLPSARACHTTTLLGRKVYLFGGFDGAKCFNSLDVLDLDSLTWFNPHVSGTVPQARNAQTVTVVGTRLLLFGGHSGNKHLHDLHVLDTETLTWSYVRFRLRARARSTPYGSRPWPRARVANAVGLRGECL
ncbi:hypothetical protein EON67_10380 [archaeon]|nr:MAG: hypothetical protein EON67_10380 [archaeon]